MDSFYQYSDFITGGVKAPDILTDISANGEGFLSFLRLVGCFYFNPPGTKGFGTHTKHQGGGRKGPPQYLKNEKCYKPETFGGVRSIL